MPLKLKEELDVKLNLISALLNCLERQLIVFRSVN